MDAPVVVEVVRGGMVESRHRGSAVVLDGSHAVLRQLGDVATPMFPRSCAKPLQAVGMVEAGLADVLGGDRQLLAIAAASHSGEPAHVAAVRRLLAVAGLDEDALANTADLPLDPRAAAALLAAGGGPDRLHQNCSGKHAAMLATCTASGWDTGGYLDPHHPLQRHLAATIARLTGEPVAATAVDGCGAPLFATSLTGLARAYAGLVDAPAGTSQRSVADAMRAHPFVVGGSGREASELMAELPGCLAKDGAEGCLGLALPGGPALALKVEDGAARARLPFAVAVLRRVGVRAPVLDRLSGVPVLGGGVPVGDVRGRVP